MTYSWDFYGEMIDVYAGEPVSNLYATSNNEYSLVPIGKERLRFTTNHDESAWNATPMTLFAGTQGATAATVMTVFLQGVPLIYTGQEVGREANVSFFTNTPINWNTYPDMLSDYQQIYAAFADLEVAKYGTLSTFSNNDVFCIRKVLDEEELCVIVNPRSDAVNYTLPTVLKNTTWNDAITGASVSLDTSLTIAPYDYLIMVK
jgi:1,4-alpha-glucan branching enzyme